MRKITLLTVAALTALTTAFGQPAPTRQKAPQAKTKKMPERKRTPLSEVTLNKDLLSTDRQKPQQAIRSMMAKSRSAQRMKVKGAAKTAKVRKDDVNVITEQPEGKYYDMVLSTWYYASTMFGTVLSQNSGYIGDVVEGTDGCIYIRNLITELATDEDYWVKAEKLSGDTIVIHEQPIWVEDYYGDIYIHYIKKLLVEGNQLVEPENTDIKMIWKDGKLDTVDEFNTGMEFHSVISELDDGGYWYGCMNWDVHMWPQEDDVITQLPGSGETIDMVMKYMDESGEPLGRSVSVTFIGNDIYLQPDKDREVWIMGTLEGDKVSFPSGQYLGKDLEYNCHEYFIVTDTNDELTDEAVFTYDAVTKTLTSKDIAIYINSGKDNLYYLDRFESPTIFAFNEVPATPQKPRVEYVEPYTAYPTYGMGYGYIGFYAPYFDAEGNYLNPEKMYYKLYVDDKVFTFDPSTYFDFEEPTDIVPFLFNGSDFYTSEYSHEITTYMDPVKNVGIQLIYTGGGETHESEIDWYEVDSYIADGEEGVIAHVEDGAPNMDLGDGEIALNLGFAESNSYAYGTANANDETYDVAFHLTDPSLVGATIVAINVPFFDAEEISGAKVWLSKSLSVDDGKFTPDALSQDFEAGRGFTKVVLDKPYTITEDGIYVGYTFTQAANASATPVVLTGYTSDGGFLIHTDKVYRNGWFNQFGQYGDLALEAVLKGGNIKALAVSPEYAQDLFAQVNEESRVRMDVTNYGYQGAKDIDYSYEVAGMSGTGHIDLDPALEAAYGAYHNFSIPIPAIAQKGSYPLTIKVTKVNGEANEAIASGTQAMVSVLTVMPQKRPVLEEYTGTWCGWCPRGMVALEKMARLYPDDFIGIAYHEGDPMQFTEYFPSVVEGYPEAWLDRIHATDPYIGDYQDFTWGIEELWLDRCKDFGVADISLTADWADEEQDAIDIRTTVNFPIAVDNSPYVMEYALVADGLKGTGSDWAQTNNYSGDTDYPADLLKFIAAGSSVTNLTYNDVVVALETASDILPKSIPEDGFYGFVYQMKASDGVNLDGEPLVQDKNKVNVVAMLINSKTGEIVNAVKTKVMPAGTGISSTTTSRTIDSVSYYDLSGRKVLLPNGGVYIQSTRYKDGTTLNKKVLVK